MVAILKFQIILPLNLCAVSEVRWDNEARAGGSEPGFTRGPASHRLPHFLGGVWALCSPPGAPVPSHVAACQSYGWGERTPAATTASLAAGTPDSLCAVVRKHDVT